MNRPLLGVILLVLGAAGIAAELAGLRLPTASWFFDTSRAMRFLHTEQVLWFGWLSAGAAMVTGIYLIVRACLPHQVHPAAARRRARFYELKRGVWSLRIVLLLVFIAGLDFLIVGNKPLVMKYEGKLYYPAFERKVFQGQDFGVEGKFSEAPANYRSIQSLFSEDSGNWMILPIVPYAPTGDTLPPSLATLRLGDDQVYRVAGGKPYSGLAARVYAPDPGSEDSALHMRYRLRHGRFSGPADGWDKSGERIYGAEFTEGQIQEEAYYGTGELEGFLTRTPNELQVIRYHPAPPSLSHPLGTDSNGNDVLAYLIGGLQVNIQAALFYIPCVYFIGVSLGLMMGYFGGWFDLILQRIIEALEAIPMLFVLIIISSVIPVEFKGLGMIVAILVIFGWMGQTYLMRSAAYKEKARDYVSAAKVLGASTPRILMRHILPNILSILVTVIPFSIAGVVTAVTSLDYLGFGLPPQYASWGKLLEDGLNNLSAPWLASTAFLALVITLTLITFVGEAIREAWDPRQFTIYK